MHFALLIRADDAKAATLSPDELQGIGPAVDAFDEALSTAGQNLGSVRLQPAAKTVTLANGKPFATDGPFAETKEQVGGIYLIEAKDLEEAVAIAGRLPTIKFCSVDVHPLQGIDLRAKVLQTYA